jgi:hypothetical protein
MPPPAPPLLITPLELLREPAPPPPPVRGNRWLLSLNLFLFALVLAGAAAGEPATARAAVVAFMPRP